MTTAAPFHNPRVDRETNAAGLSDWLAPRIFDLEECAIAGEIIGAWPGYRPTPLRRLDGLAAGLGIGDIAYKDESGRFGLGSFKALGGAFAVYTLLADEVERRRGVRPTSAELASGEHADVARAFTVASATAGNHGRSIAWGAQMFGCNARIYVHSGVGNARVAAIANFGADVTRIVGDYDQSVRAAAAAAAANGWTVVSDTSYGGYVEIPRRVMLGYTVMVAELLDQLAGRSFPTHVLLPAGVGGLAAAVTAYLALRMGPERPRVVIVEPQKADCLYQSAVQGRPSPARGGLGSFMLGLDCAEVSLIAWEVLDRLADDFVLVSESDALHSMRQLNLLAGIDAGECAGIGLAALDAAQRRGDSESLGLGAGSRVLLIGTEGTTDPVASKRLLSEDD